MGHQRKTNPSFLATPIANRIGIRDERSASGRSIDPLAQRFVITLCDYGTCPTIKSNNAIKTMIVEILECLRNPTGGRALVLGYDVSKRSDQAEIRKRIGVLPQDFNAIDRLTVRENIDYFGAMFKQQLDADKLIELVDLKDKR